MRRWSQVTGGASLEFVPRSSWGTLLTNRCTSVAEPMTPSGVVTGALVVVEVGSVEVVLLVALARPEAGVPPEPPEPPACAAPPLPVMGVVAAAPVLGVAPVPVVPPPEAEGLLPEEPLELLLRRKRAASPRVRVSLMSRPTLLRM